MTDQGSNDFGEQGPNSGMNRRPTPPLPGPKPLPTKVVSIVPGLVPPQREPSPVVVTMDELRALAATVRQCQRNGHPDLTKHLDALLGKLGA